jgi:hypothetical protein
VEADFFCALRIIVRQVQLIWRVGNPRGLWLVCRCGNEFCYTCGAKWKNKVASCRCKLWDESNIVRSRPGRRFLRGNFNLN